jgi:hypothetical protein
MPVDQDEAPRLAEIARSITDFRNEFREAVATMVRRDVYAAEMRTIEVRLAALATEISRIEREGNAEVKRVDEEMERDRQERRAQRNIIFGTGLTAAASLAIIILQAVIK